MPTDYDAAFWEKQHALDPERRIHKDVRLYWIWNEKANFLRRTVASNPFQSTFFAWVDIGYFRTKSYNGATMIRTIPPTLRNDQVLMLDVRGLVSVRGLAQLNYVGGGFIGGYADGINQFHAKYYALLDTHKRESGKINRGCGRRAPRPPVCARWWFRINPTVTRGSTWRRT